MQNKGLVKLFALLFGLVSIYQIAFTFKGNQIEKQAKQFAVSQVSETEAKYDSLRSVEELKYLDSISKIEVYNIGIASYTYDEVKDKAMNLGLDLKGGIDVTLQVSVKDILRGLANKSEDPIFNQALTDADELQKNAQESYLESFYRAFDAIKGDTKLASPDIFANRSLSEEVTFDMSDDAVKRIISTKVDESIVSVFEVLRKRIDKFGVTQPNIQRVGNSGRIIVELPGARDKERAKRLLQRTAQLEFWDVYNPNVFSPFIVQADAKLKELITPKTEDAVEDDTNTDDADTANQDSNVNDLLGDTTETEVAESAAIANPLIGLIKIGGGQGSASIGRFDLKDTTVVSGYLRKPEIRALLSPAQRDVKFLWGLPEIDPALIGSDLENVELVELFAIKGNRENEPELNGAVVVDAGQSFDLRNQPVVTMQMNAKGAKGWEEMTGRAFNQGTNIAVVLDDVVYSAPGVTTGPISGGNTEISGSFTLNEAVDLANVLRAGKLSARADVIRASEVGPSLGAEAISTGTKSFIIALVLVLIWMMFYYGKAGIFSNIALLLNILLVFGILSGLGAVLTLPGIAGIVLTIGIAVDANVLIYERVREELTKGKGQKEAIKDGFSNALSSILDANITTGLTALILFVFGTGPIKGFATTLLIGIITSLFTAIFITRLLIDWNTNRKGKLTFSTPITKGLFRNINIEFLKRRKIAYVVSGIVIVAGLGSLFTTGLDQGIDFVGGRTYQVRFAQDTDIENVKTAVIAELGSAEVKTIGGANQFKISTKYKVDENTAEVDEEVQRKLYESIKSFLPNNFSYEKFNEGENNLGKMSSSKVSPTIADDIKKSSIWAILGSLIVVFLYILLRFKKWQFSLGAVAAVFHDVLIVLGIFSITWKFMPFSMEIDQAFIAAILTVIGYSLNDTVVVFDRIREFLNEHTSWDFSRVVDSALSSTLSRTLNTSLTTLVVLLAMFIFGADSLRGLLFALMVGVIVGTYSSVFIATPVMNDTIKRIEKKKK
ncbi:protein translocase subunit SecDF [Flavobacteriaceae bacterium AU392]|nr:protein translocase subunit SecDF [Flavobacteriaceae bacterium]RKM81289.1 protein translocase subunit SecDF [Flavobacteriaceae bacterium AU392]